MRTTCRLPTEIIIRIYRYILILNIDSLLHFEKVFKIKPIRKKITFDEKSLEKKLKNFTSRKIRYHCHQATLLIPIDFFYPDERNSKIYNLDLKERKSVKCKKSKK